MANASDSWGSPSGEPETPRGFTPPQVPPPPQIPQPPLAGNVTPQPSDIIPPPPGFHATPPGAPGIPPAPGYGAYPTYPKNWMGIVALIAPFAGCIIPGGGIAGIIFGHLALAAYERGEANNRGLALAGLIVSYVFTAIGLMYIFAFIAF